MSLEIKVKVDEESVKAIAKEVSKIISGPADTKSGSGDEKEYYSVNDIHVKYGLGVQSIRKLAKKNFFNVIKPGGKFLLIEKKSFQQYISDTSNEFNNNK